MEEEKCYKIFLEFCAMDPEEKGFINVDILFDYVGGERTKFTERIFFYKDRNYKDKNLDFSSFLILLWNYCTLSPTALARMLFEIYDPDKLGKLEPCDLETMYRMMYDTNDINSECIKSFPYQQGYVDKGSFMNYCKSHYELIQPAIDYQKILKKRLGGTLSWESIILNRRLYFNSYELQVTFSYKSNCLNISL